MALIWKKGYFWPTFHIFLVTREKLLKFLQHISHLHTYMYFAYPIEYFALPILKKNFGVIQGVDSYSRHFGTLNK